MDELGKFPVGVGDIPVLAEGLELVGSGPLGKHCWFGCKKAPVRRGGVKLASSIASSAAWLQNSFPSFCPRGLSERAANSVRKRHTTNPFWVDELGEVAVSWVPWRHIVVVRGTCCSPATSVWRRLAFLTRRTWRAWMRCRMAVAACLFDFMGSPHISPV